MRMNFYGQYILEPDEMHELVLNIFGTRNAVVREYYKVTQAHKEFHKTMEGLKNEDRDRIPG